MVYMCAFSGIQTCIEGILIVFELAQFFTVSPMCLMFFKFVKEQLWGSKKDH